MHHDAFRSLLQQQARDPDRWVTSTPAAFNMAVTSVHRIPLGVGFLNTSFSVR